MLKNKTVLVTGGAGFIGSNLAHALCSDNVVVVVDDLSTGNLRNIQSLIDAGSVEFVRGSVTDLDLLRRICAGVDVIFHHAAQVSVPRSMKDPLGTHVVNVGGTLKVLLAARDNNVSKVVFASSCAVYGDTRELPIKESTPVNPLSPYALSKVMGEQYGDLFTRIFDLPTVCLRYFNVYGPRQNPRGEYAAVIPKFIQNALAGRPLTIYGDGTQTRDFVYVDDVVRINIEAATQETTGVFNVGSGNSLSIQQLAESIKTATKIEFDILHQREREGDIRYSYADISKLKEQNIEPEVSLSDGLNETFKYFSKV